MILDALMSCFFQSFGITPQPLLWTLSAPLLVLGSLGIVLERRAFLVEPVHTMEVAEDENRQNSNAHVQGHQNDLGNQTEI